MPDPDDTETAESHGVHGAPREDGRMQEEPDGAGDAEQGAEKTQAGGDRT